MRVDRAILAVVEVMEENTGSRTRWASGAATSARPGRPTSSWWITCGSMIWWKSNSVVKRLYQALLIGTFLPLCWFAMMAVHELGHVLSAVATGGTIATVVLHPLTISRTDVSSNPHPLLVAWAGPMLGVLLPLAIFLAAKASRFKWAYLVQFFAGFCLIANGAYIGVGSLGGVGDAGDMLGSGSPTWLLWLFGAVTFPSGLYVWNGLGPHFGLGPAAGEVDHRAAYASSLLLVVTLIVELAVSSR